MRPADVAGAKARRKPKVLGYADLRPGTCLRGFSQEIVGDHLWVALGPNIRCAASQPVPPLPHTTTTTFLSPRCCSEPLAGCVGNESAALEYCRPLHAVRAPTRP